MQEEDIDRDMLVAARDFMSALLLRKLPGHISKETDFSSLEAILCVHNQERSAYLNA
jgi:hypothetical protein